MSGPSLNGLPNHYPYMRTETKTFNVYKFNELSEDAQNRAVNSELNAMLEVAKIEDLSPSMQEAIAEAERLQTPWFLNQIIWESCEDEVREWMNSNEYLENGEWYGKI